MTGTERRLPALLLDSCAAIVVTGSLVVGGVAAVREILLVFRDAPLRVFHPELRQSVARINELSSPDEPIFYIMRKRESWESRLWHRALYPRPVFYIDDESQVDSAHYRRLRAKYRIRYAVSVGDPPIDPGFNWYVELRSFPQRAVQIWFGKLR